MSDPRDGFFESFPKLVFDLTGYRLGSVIKFVAVLLVAVIGIAYTIFHTDAEVRKNSNSGTVNSREPTDKEKLRNISQLPTDFSNLLAVEQLSILNSKIEIGEALATSDGEMVDQATEHLVFLYGVRCGLEESEGIDSDQTYRRMAGLRQQALATGNEHLAVSLDFLRALAAASRLNRRAEKSDFRFAADAILNLDSSNLVNPNEASKLCANAITLLENASDKDSAKLFASIISDKLTASPEIEVSHLGRSLEDYVSYSRFYYAAQAFSDSSREERLKLYQDLFDVFENSPPQSATTYKVIIQLLDRLLNSSDIDIAKTLIERLSETASAVDPAIKVRFDQSLQNIRTRASALGTKINLSGSIHDGSSLQLPNGKPTVLLFWRPDVLKSAEHIRFLGGSQRFDQWKSNVLVASQSEITEENFKILAKSLSSFIVLDNATAKRLADDLGIDLVPYQVSLDKEGTVIRLGASN